MARHFTPKRLTNILDAIADIETLTRGQTLDHYRSDRFMRLAVERCLEIISEASRFIPEKLRAAYPALRWRGIADFGSVLRHGYDSVDVGRVWAIIEHELMPLKAAVEAIRNKLSSAGDG